MPDRPGVSALLSRNLVAYLLSRFCSGCAMTMLRAGIAWHVFALTNSAFHLGLIGAASSSPRSASCSSPERWPTCGIGGAS